MQYEDAQDAIRKVREWVGGNLAEGDHVDARVNRIIDAILNAYELSYWLHDVDKEQDASVDLLWKIDAAVDIRAIQKAIEEAREVSAEAERRRIPE